jgi:hypothetical protein
MAVQLEMISWLPLNQPCKGLKLSLKLCSVVEGNE